jgi:hypothetical protein
MGTTGPEARALTWTGDSVLYGFTSGNILTINAATGAKTDTGVDVSGGLRVIAAAYPVSGSVAVPEPGTLALLAGAAGVALLSRPIQRRLIKKQA